MIPHPIPSPVTSCSGQIKGSFRASNDGGRKEGGGVPYVKRLGKKLGVDLRSFALVGPNRRINTMAVSVPGLGDLEVGGGGGGEEGGEEEV